MNHGISTKSNHIDWLNKGPWYNRKICSKLHGIRLEDFIIQARTYLYNLMCSLVDHDRLQHDYEDDVSSIGDRAIPNYATIKTLDSLGANLNFIYIWLKWLRENYCARSESYINATKEILMQIPQNVEITLTSKEKSKNC